MPLQNRVTPFGEIVAIPQRGAFIGNRGIIHNPATRTLLKKRWSLKAWLICRLHYKDNRRVPMARRSWTELFFLDEATALAAGHRPCFLCRRSDAEAFRLAWTKGNGGNLPAAPELDAILHRERLDGSDKRVHPLRVPIEKLPEGAMLAAGKRAYLIVSGGSLLWSPDGYTAATLPAKIDGLLTPPSIVAALRAGYRPAMHPSARRP